MDVGASRNEWLVFWGIYLHRGIFGFIVRESSYVYKVGEDEASSSSAYHCRKDEKSSIRPYTRCPGHPKP